MKACPILPLFLLAACALSPVPTSVPYFDADDPRVETAGFVRETLRLSRDVGDTTYTFMAFRVGETVTLGAMVEGTFDGSVEWRVGPHALEFPFGEQPPEGPVPIELRNPPKGVAEVFAEGAAFRGTRWINLDLEAELWMPAEGTPVTLLFHPHSGATVQLPGEGPAYAVRFVLTQAELSEG